MSFAEARGLPADAINADHADHVLYERWEALEGSVVAFYDARAEEQIAAAEAEWALYEATYEAADR